MTINLDGSLNDYGVLDEVEAIDPDNVQESRGMGRGDSVWIPLRREWKIDPVLKIKQFYQKREGKR